MTDEIKKDTEEKTEEMGHGCPHAHGHGEHHHHHHHDHECGHEHHHHDHDHEHHHHHDHEHMEEDEEVLDVIEVSDDDGNTIYFTEEETFMVGDVKYAVMVEVKIDEAEDDVHIDDDAAATIAKVVRGEDGTEAYEAPTDEEFAAASEAYEALHKDEEEA